VRVLCQEVPQCLQVAQDPNTIISRHRTAQLQQTQQPSVDSKPLFSSPYAPLQSSHHSAGVDNINLRQVHRLACQGPKWSGGQFTSRQRGRDRPSPVIPTFPPPMSLRVVPLHPSTKSPHSNAICCPFLYTRYEDNETVVPRAQPENSHHPDSYIMNQDYQQVHRQAPHTVELSQYGNHVN
jgi:hypothetical protein